MVSHLLGLTLVSVWEFHPLTARTLRRALKQTRTGAVKPQAQKTKKSKILLHTPLIAAFSPASQEKCQGSRQILL
ncbi:MAG: hypothetical protein CMK07_01235 [Ponticaulis sp.]|nr:hypothetical protein [Ponticaulis sp.]